MGLPRRGASVAPARTGLALAAIAALALIAAGSGTGAGRVPRRGVRATLPPIHHVFVIVLENESESAAFGPSSRAPYLAHTLVSEGALLSAYYAIGHASNDNYIAMISGQPPNIDNQADCQSFVNFNTDAVGAYGAQEGIGCVYPPDIPNIATQLDSAGLSWRAYAQDMGNDPQRESARCGHPPVGAVDNTQTATPTDMYATRHDPFVYFHAIIDNRALCDSHVVNLDLLRGDLRSVASTPNYAYIIPDLCDDGHDSPCANGQPGGLVSANQFLEKWVPIIIRSPAFRDDNGLLLITFDEASGADASSCCGEIPGPGSRLPGIFGPGGGRVGAVVLSPCVAPGTVSSKPYNHYSMLRSVEDIFHLPHLAYAQLPGERSFGSDVFTRRCDITPLAALRAPFLAVRQSAGPTITLRLGALRAPAYVLQVQARVLAPHRGRWRTIAHDAPPGGLRFRGRPGNTYRLRARAVGGAGAGPWTYATSVLPSGPRPAGARYRGPWRRVALRRAWLGQALQTRSPGASLTLSYSGRTLAIIGVRGPRAGVVRVLIGGRARTVSLRAGREQLRAVLLSLRTTPGRHLLKLKVLRGQVAIEGFAG
jgi:hypothetical protein